MTKIQQITSCRECKWFDTKPIYTSDSFERPEKWVCTNKIGLVIDGYHDTFDKDPGIPKQCPL